MALNLNKQTSIIPKNERESRPVYTRGGRLRYLGMPTDSAGNITLDTPVLNFQGSFDGKYWFSINDYAGRPVSVTARPVQKVIHIDNSLATSPAILPIGESIPSEGVQMLRVSGNVIEQEDRAIDFYFE